MRSEDQKKSFYWKVVDMKNTEVVPEQGSRQRGKLSETRGKCKVVYININGLVMGLIELNIFLQKASPDIIGLTEIKLHEEIEVKKIGQDKYNTWKKSRLN